MRKLSAPAGGFARAGGTLLLLALVLAAYRPILPGNFLMDDWRLIATDNPLSNGQFTPFNLWFQTDFTLSSLALWLQYLAWGHAPGWYHVVNLLLHALSAGLVWRLLATLKIPGAWLAAALFAVHPVCVNSVARIAEIKNTLSLPFFLLACLAWFHHEAAAPDAPTAGPDGSRRSRACATAWHVLALLAFVAALLAKTSTVMLPVILLAGTAWQRGRIGRRDWLQIAPFLVLALACGLMSVWYQKHQALFSAGEILAPESFWQRFAIAGHVLVFYLGKAWLPIHLSLVYPKWQFGAPGLAAFLPHLLLGAGAILCWRFRRSWGRAGLFGLGCYFIALFPSLGLFDSQFLVLWQVSDHLQYLPLVAPLALAAAVLAANLPQRAYPVVAAGLVAGLGLLTYQRAEVFTSDEQVMRDSIAKNPGDWYARNELGIILARRNDTAAARAQFEAALATHPENSKVHSNLAHLLSILGQAKEAEVQYQTALALNPSDDSTCKNFADLLRREGRNRAAIIQYERGLGLKPDVPSRLALAGLYYQIGNAGPAIRQYREILKAEPDQVEALTDLAWILATFGEANQRNGAEAVRDAEKACALTGFKQVKPIGTLAAAYAEAGRYAEAAATDQKAINLANATGDKATAALSGQLLNLYQSGQPLHTPPPGNSPEQ